uniref:phosphoethanolamine N-methyltransferase n=1 Tax=Meloidogyne incognita TaxID=6306 RepID=A0A914LUS3_MELIC
MLPSFKNKFVVDIGAGIGLVILRFTTEFAKKARKVVSTDFVASFIEKNRERNVAFNNIEWRVGDAVKLDFEEGSIDIVFTNWLLMYLVDEEVVQFLINAIKWLRPGGYLHLRESCSEPSSKKSNNSLHSISDSINPTKYRLSSAYIQLLKSINFKSKDGTVWGFKIHWASSVNVYIQKNANWRQVHWLVSKVPKKEKFMPNLGTMLGEKWPEEQKEWDNKLDLALNENQNVCK